MRASAVREDESMERVLRFVVEHTHWLTILALSGAAVMALGWLYSLWDWRNKRDTLLEDFAYTSMWRYGVTCVLFLLAAGGVQLVARAAPDGHFVLARLWNPAARPVAVTPTPSPTPIPVPNLIPTPTPTVTPTATPTATPTVTPTPTATPVPVLHPGGRARIEAETLNVRAGPGVGHERVGVLLQGQTVSLIEGPQEADGYRWWHIRTEDGLEGWVAEGTNDVQWVVPLP